jgi:cysteinyl-tRNA synthetase
MNAKKAVAEFHKELGKRIVKYEKRTGKKLPKNTIKHISAIVNLDERHGPDDIQKLIKYLEEKLGTKVIQVAIHKDEGYINENGERHINYHAHIEMVGLDNEGRSIRKKLDRKTLREIQTDIAKILGMERGQDVRKTRRKRLNTYQYKEAMRIKEAEIAELKKELKNKEEIIKKLRKNNEKIMKENEELKAEKARLIKALKDIRRAIKTLNKYVAAYNKEDYKRISELQYILRKEPIEDIRQIYQGINELMTNLVIKLKNDRDKKIVKEELNKIKEQYNLDSTLDM